MIVYNNHVLPESNHKLLNLLIDINKKKPTVEIKENVFIDAFEGYNIYVRHKNDKTGEVGDVQIFESDPKVGLLKTVTAEKGTLRYLEKEGILRFELENAEIHEMPRGSDASAYRRTILKNYVMNIKDVDRSLTRSERNYRGDREMSSGMMRDKIAEIRGDIVDVQAKMSEMATAQIGDALALLRTASRDSVSRAAAGSAAEIPSPEPSSGVREPSSGTPEPPPGAPTSSPGTPKPRIQAHGAGIHERVAEEPSKISTTRRALESQRDIRNSYSRQIDRYRVEIHKKYSIPFACIIFVLIGSPIAIRLGRSGMNTAIGLSLLVFLVYYVCLIGGEKLADREFVSPLMAMWVPNVLFGAAAVLLIRSATLEQNVVRLRLVDILKAIRRN
jgi:lipopolysaccharide export system permease protein